MSNGLNKEFGARPDDVEVESRARAIFRSACEGTDSYHALRLGLARRRALAAGPSRFTPAVWAPLAGIAACGLLVAGVWMHPVAWFQPGAVHAPVTAAATGQREGDEVIPEIGSSQQEMVENLDFYRWLAAQPGVASAAPGGRR